MAFSPTYLNIVNEVLKRMREDEVAGVESDSRARVIGSLVNVAKEEVENAWNWTVLKQDLTLNTQYGYDEDYLTGSTARTRFIRTEEAEEGYNTTNRGILRRVPNGWLDRVRHLSGTPYGAPSKFAVAGRHADGRIKLRFDKKPDAVYALVFPCIVCQDPLSADGDLLTVPWRPVLEKSYLLAIMERGEDIGQSSEAQALVIRQSMNDAIGSDMEKIDDEGVWVPR